MTEHSKVLSKGRKKRVMPEGLATVDEIEKLGLLSSHPLHKSTKVGFCGGFSCLIMCFVPDEPGRWRLLHMLSSALILVNLRSARQEGPGHKSPNPYQRLSWASPLVGFLYPSHKGGFANAGRHTVH